MYDDATPIFLMNLAELSQKTLDEILTSLGFPHEIAVEEDEKGVLCLNILSEDARFIIGEEGDRLDDLQYLVNRMVQFADAEAPRVKVDCDHYRERTEARLIQKAQSLAEKALASGRPFRMQPLNAYHRRLVHNAIAEIDGVTTESEEGDRRFKRITIRPL